VRKKQTRWVPLVVSRVNETTFFVRDPTPSFTSLRDQTRRNSRRVKYELPAGRPLECNPLGASLWQLEAGIWRRKYDASKSGRFIPFVHYFRTLSRFSRKSAQLSSCHSIRPSATRHFYKLPSFLILEIDNRKSLVVPKHYPANYIGTTVSASGTLTTVLYGLRADLSIWCFAH
jgi:hypothetical protein